jgi:hypothetical protein
MMSNQTAIRTCYFLDPMGSAGRTPEEEAIQQTGFFEDEYGCKLDYHMARNTSEIQDGTELLLFDFGGMMMGNSLCEDNSRRVIQWAEDHPSSLVVIISAFTYNNVFRYEIQDFMGLETAPPYDYNIPDEAPGATPIHNIVVSASNCVPKWFRDAHGMSEGYTGEVEKLTKPSPAALLEAEADTILIQQRLDPDRRLRVQKTLEAMQKKTLLGVPSLPSQTFFNPSSKFLTYMKTHFKNWKIYDVGSGMGHVTKALRKAGCKNTKALDINTREHAAIEPEFGDGTTYPFKAGSVVMLCRPCHGYFPGAVIANAIECRAGAIIYVGLVKNVKDDLGVYYRKFKRVLTNVGEEKENLWVYQGKK